MHEQRYRVEATTEDEYGPETLTWPDSYSYRDDADATAESIWDFAGSWNGGHITEVRTVDTHIIGRDNVVTLIDANGFVDVDAELDATSAYFEEYTGAE